jgi:hypothetical protein
MHSTKLRRHRDEPLHHHCYPTKHPWIAWTSACTVIEMAWCSRTPLVAGSWLLPSCFQAAGCWLLAAARHTTPNAIFGAALMNGRRVCWSLSQACETSPWQTFASAKGPQFILAEPPPRALAQYLWFVPCAELLDQIGV